MILCYSDPKLIKTGSNEEKADGTNNEEQGEQSCTPAPAPWKERGMREICSTLKRPTVVMALRFHIEVL